MTHRPDDGVTSIVITSDNRSLGVCQWGDSTGAPVFWLHGTPGSRLLRHRSADYREHRLRVITYDRPGYGLSTRHVGRRVADAAADVRAIADAIGVSRFAVAGISEGAPAALATAALLRRRVVRCATVAGPAPFRASGLDFFAGMDQRWRRRWERAAEGAEALGEEWQEVTDWVLGGFPGVDLSDASRRRLREAMQEAVRAGPDGFVDDCLALVDDWGFRVEDVLPRTRIMVARDDDAVPAAHGEWLLHQVRRAELVRVDGGHHGPRDDAELDLLSWLGHGDENPD